jgi:uncharacterized membrane protein
MINFAHLHLILNHLPIMTIPLALIFYIFSIYKNNNEFKKFSLMIIVGAAATVIPVYLTGEPAEEVVENLAGVSKNLIENHEEMAEISLVLTLIGGGISLIVLFLGGKFEFLNKIGEKLVIGSCVIALGLLIYTANKGGKIRHPELRTKSDLINKNFIPEKAQHESDN